jgi:hypothetical protein
VDGARGKYLGGNHGGSGGHPILGVDKMAGRTSMVTINELTPSHWTIRAALRRAATLAITDTLKESGATNEELSLLLQEFLDGGADDFEQSLVKGFQDYEKYLQVMGGVPKPREDT